MPREGEHFKAGSTLKDFSAFVVGENSETLLNHLILTIVDKKLCLIIMLDNKTIAKDEEGRLQISQA